MKRTRAQQPKAPEPQDPAAAADAGNPKPQRRAKQPRQPKGAAKKLAASSAAVAAASASPAPTVPDVSFAVEEADAAPQAVDWDLDAGLGLGGASGAAWWTWGVEEDKLLGWFPFVEEDFRCLAGRATDAAEPAFDDDIWRIHQIHEIRSYAAK